jgi:hypothetical protein
MPVPSFRRNVRAVAMEAERQVDCELDRQGDQCRERQRAGHSRPGVGAPGGTWRGRPGRRSHVEQPSPPRPCDVGVHAGAQRARVERAGAEDVVRIVLMASTICTGETPAGQPDERLAHPLRAVLRGEPGDDEVAAGPRVLRRDGHAEAVRRARHGVAHRLAEGDVERKQLDARDGGG